MDDALPMWVVYDHPPDHPTMFVAKEVLVSAAGPVESGQCMMAPDLHLLRAFLQNSHFLIPMARAEDDDPYIVETWF